MLKESPNWDKTAMLKESQDWDKTAMLGGRSTSSHEVDLLSMVNLGTLDSGDSWNDSTRETGSTAIKETKPCWNDSTREKAATA